MPAQHACLADPAARGQLCVRPDGGGPGRVGATELRLADGERVFAAGDAADGLFGIRQGAVMLAGSLADGRRQIFAFLYSGDTFGFAVDGVQSCTAITLGRTSLCRISAASIAADRRLAARVESALLDMRAAVWDHQVLLGRMGAVERVAAFLVRLWRRQGRPDDLHLPMTVGIVADHLGLRRETVSRSLSRLRRLGLVGSWDAYGFLPVVDAPALVKLVKGCP